VSFASTYFHDHLCRHHHPFPFPVHHVPFHYTSSPYTPPPLTPSLLRQIQTSYIIINENLAWYTINKATTNIETRIDVEAELSDWAEQLAERMRALRDWLGLLSPPGWTDHERMVLREAYAMLVGIAERCEYER
jgi:hypothetical protein